ncbi:GntR family transcriptional regulator [Sporomusa sp.]|uniref:GntR family transcriptional regulator n=1 Tax=Sporomusa sp. TaxID=2078658 RepID=UPI002BD3CE6C|nr:GntR family transcriptional regulator [Sporomusa sp.]HWR09500.1 GntR family transcriptional regulator [Sporomusa sp.]
MLIIEQKPQESIREYVYRFLRMNIIDLNLPPGQNISEQDVATQLSVSRTPVREAFIKLAQENLLDIIPQKGTYVSLIDIDQVEESKFARETLEKEVIQQACIDFPSEDLFQLQSCLALQELCISEKNYHQFFELDETMHGLIFKGCKKSRTWNMLHLMNAHYNRVRILNLKVKEFEWEQLLKQHRALVDAIRDHDVDLGKKTIDLHLNKVVVDLEHLRNEQGHYFLPFKQQLFTMTNK